MSLPVKCLLVDDREENLLALSALLQRDDVEILQARSGPEALELLLANDVALALLDVQMPDMDGFELAELMRGSQRTRNVPLIFVTAGARDQHRMFKGYETGAVDFLYKPIDPYILRNKADVFFQLYRQRLQLAQELRERTETLRLNEMFMAVLGHDLRTPLTGIVTSASLLQSGSQDPMVQRAAARMLASGKRMSRMIEDLLDLARARLGGGIALKRGDADLGAVVTRVVQENQSAYPDRPIELLIDGDGSGEWDVDRFAQVASNLIGNALQHGDASAPVQVTLDGSAADSVRLTVGNAGRISDEAMPHLFDPFQSGQRQSARGEGLGLGLYIVRQIVLAHQGSIDVLCDDVTRTVFVLRVPRHPSTGSKGPQAASATSAT
jgi:two-component system sensor histidine kinase/response regulator